MNRVLQVIAITVGTTLSCNLLYAQPPGRGMGGQGGPGGPPMEMIAQIFEQADANHDGSVTKAELTALMQNQERGNRRGPGGPPPQGGNFGQGNHQGQQPPQGGRHQGGEHQGGGPQNVGHQGGGPQGPPPAPGQVLPEQVAQTLDLNPKQVRMLTALQADVDKRLKAILTDEQENQLMNAGPPHGQGHGEGHGHGHAHGEAGGPNPGDDRPQRPE